MISSRNLTMLVSSLAVASAVAGCSDAGRDASDDADVSGNAVTATSVVTVDLTQRGGPLKKAGLGTLHGVSGRWNSDAYRKLITNSVINVSVTQGRIGENGSNPYSTEAVSPVIRGTGARMMCRFGDLLPGWLYYWQSYDKWMAQVDNAVQTLQANYKDVVYAVAVFNEPSTAILGDIMNDPAVQGRTHEERVNWIWTQTVRKIRAMAPGLKVMGPNYVIYSPWGDGGAERQAMMRDFLVNAINTGTVPDIIGWHALGPSPGDVPEALKYYRKLENELNLPGRPKPISIEEYGPGGDFEGVPGTMVKHWAEFERNHIDYGSMGIYENPGLIGNTLRPTFGATPLPNGGWYMLSWYRQMKGDYVPVSDWRARGYQSVDGVASWDPGAQEATVILGGQDTNVDVKILGVGALGLGSTVRVRLDSTVWDKDPNEVDKVVERGGDPKTGTYNLLDKNLPVDGSGNITVPIHRMEGYNGYRVVISRVAVPSGNYPTKYEAELGRVTHAGTHTGSDAGLASNNGFIGGIDFPDSAVEFDVNAPSAGIYVMTVRHSTGLGAATHLVSVNGEAQGSVKYPYGTSGWSATEMRTTTKRIALAAGHNTVRLAKGDGYAELDYIDVRPDTHRYEAEFAISHNARPSKGDGYYVESYVGGIDNADSSVEFVIEAPKAGTYRLNVGYASGAGSSSHRVFVDDAEQGSVAFAQTKEWLNTRDILGTEKLASMTVKLHEGLNRVRLQKGEGFAELDFVTINLP